ncbi:MAG: multidrug effflux MFS transporter [Pseudomonadota bacterium]
MFHPAATPPRLVTLILLTALATLSLNLFLPSLAAMAADFDVSYALISLTVAGYVAVTAALQLVIGPLSDRFGRRPVLLAAMAVYVIASAACVMTTDIGVFLVCRILQGVIIAGWTVSLAIVRDMKPANEAASTIGYISMVMAVAPMIGPLAGGLLDAFFGWRASFVAFTLMGLGLLILCWADLGETNAARTGGFAAQVRAYPDLLRSRHFWGYALCMAFSVGAFYAFLAGTPLVATAVFGMSTATLGAAMGSITAGFVFGSFLSGRLARRHALATMIIAGRLVACIGLAAGLVLVMAGYLNVVLLFGATIFVGIGNGLTTPSASAGAMSVRPHLAGSASGLFGALTAVVGALLTVITGALVTVETGAFMLLAIMLAASFLALLAALLVRGPGPEEI